MNPKIEPVAQSSGVTSGEILQSRTRVVLGERAFECHHCGGKFYQHMGLMHHLDRSRFCSNSEYSEI